MNDWTKSLSLTESCTSRSHSFYKKTRLFQLEVVQLGTELSTAIASKPTDSTTVCYDNPNLELLSLNLDQFAKRLSSYDAPLTSATQNGPCVSTIIVSPSATTRVEATVAVDATSNLTPMPPGSITAVTEPMITTVSPVLTTISRPSSTIPNVVEPTLKLPLIVDHTTPNLLTSRSMASELVTAMGMLAEKIVLSNIVSPINAGLTAALAIPNNKNGLSEAFDPTARNNVAVYYGQTELTGSTSLADQCADPNIDIVLLSFLTTTSGPGGLPSIDFGPACKGQTSEQQLKASGLLSCPSLAADITSCQNMGKKVLLSIGGSVAQTSFADDDAAKTFAQNVWDLFGGGTGYSNDLRPFGAVKLDGFDIDNESHSQSGYVAFASQLRSLFSSDSSKQYFLSAAPQCVFPDASIPLGAMALADFVWVQFYNNDCAITADADTFMGSLQQWSSTLFSQNNSTRLYIGLLGWSNGGAGYVDHAALQASMDLVKKANLPNIGGIMLWDGPMSRANLDTTTTDTNGGDGTTYVQAAKNSLQGI